MPIDWKAQCSVAMVDICPPLWNTDASCHARLHGERMTNPQAFVSMAFGSGGVRLAGDYKLWRWLTGFVCCYNAQQCVPSAALICSALFITRGFYVMLNCRARGERVYYFQRTLLFCPQGIFSCACLCPRKLYGEMRKSREMQRKQPLINDVLFCNLHEHIGIL